jgi:hypothetical protein
VRLQRVKDGVEVLIRYTGLQTSKAGREFKGFEVFIEEMPWEEGAVPLGLIRHEEG